ncbi:MAG: hypothetical protein LBI02_04895 [Opitutaceae bacterium]|jgi:hypothetical protein|nr:hypothetical protein [Opitutaceae bacterium]
MPAPHNPADRPRGIHYRYRQFDTNFAIEQLRKITRKKREMPKINSRPWCSITATSVPAMKIQSRIGLLSTTPQINKTP